MKISKIILLLIGFFAFGCLWSQEYDTSDLLTFKSPTEHFKDIVIQSHKGLPRFGVHNSYTIERATPRNKRSFEVKQRLIMNGKHNYNQLIGLKYAETIMKDLDTEKPTTMNSSSQDAKENNNADSQQALRNIISPIFCDSDLCSNPYNGKNEFERLKNYKVFTNEVLPDLLKWSKTFFKNDVETVYYVSRFSSHSTYDFDKKGYWVYISFNLFPNRQSRSFRMESIFNPKKTYENSISSKLDKRDQVTIFVPMDEATAEDIQVNKNNLYIVRKIQLSIPKEPRKSLRLLQFYYNHLSPTIEIYKDEALTQMVGSLSMENLTFKE